MPQLSAITGIINAHLSQQILNTDKYQGGKYDEIADLVSEKIGETFIKRPGIIDNYGEIDTVEYDDTYPIQIYHRILSLNYEVAQMDNYGDEVQALKETAQMTMVIISDRQKTQVLGEDLIALIAVNMPAKLTNVELLSLNLYSANMYASGEAIVDNEQIFNREYQNVEYNLKPNSVMYALSYTIETVFDRKCFPHCTT